jgi:hypothetical protein
MGEWALQGNCRNPTLAKCGGEAQHLEKLEVWSPPGLPNVQSLTTRPKTPRIEAFLVSLERSWNGISKMALHWPFRHLQPKLWAKEGPGVKLAIWLPTTKSRELTSSRHRLEECDTTLESSWKAFDKSYNFGLGLVPIRTWGEELWPFKVPGVQPGQFWDSISGFPTKCAIWM